MTRSSTGRVGPVLPGACSLKNDKTKILVKQAEVDFVPNEELGAPTTALPPAPPTTAAP